MPTRTEIDAETAKREKCVLRLLSSYKGDWVSCATIYDHLRDNGYHSTNSVFYRALSQMISKGLIEKDCVKTGPKVLRDSRHYHHSSTQNRYRIKR